MYYTKYFKISIDFILKAPTLLSTCKLVLKPPKSLGIIAVLRSCLWHFLVALVTAANIITQFAAINFHANNSICLPTPFTVSQDLFRPFLAVLLPLCRRLFTGDIRFASFASFDAGCLRR